MRSMAIDYGEKRVGIASTDDSGSFALPRAVWSNDGALMGKVLKFVTGEHIERIVIGESTNLDGRVNPIQHKIEAFKHELEQRSSELASQAKIVLHPEVLTTIEARRLQGQTEMTDASAAALILKSFLDTMYNKDA